MKWSKLKSKIENQVCDSLQKRFAINSTVYGNCTCGHAWITLDQQIIANFCTRAFWNTNPIFDKEKGKYIAGNNQEISNVKYKNLFNEYGELSRQNIYKSCWTYIHDLSIEEALISEDPLIQTLSVIDKRVGKRRLKNIQLEKLHPLAKKLLEERIKSEKILPVLEI